MKHRVLLRRALPLAVLTAVLLTSGLPASALFFGRSETPTVAPISKNGSWTEPIAFSQSDFVVDGSAKLDSIVIAALPDSAAGILDLGGQALQVGDTVAMEAVDGLCFRPAASSAAAEEAVCRAVTLPPYVTTGVTALFGE